MTEIENRRNLRDLAFEVAALTTLVDYLNEKKDQIRAEFAIAAAEAGADASKAMLFGEEIAKISVVAPKPKPQIIDEQAFFNHIKTFQPHEIHEVVRESFRKVFLQRLAPHEDGAIDPWSGEIIDFVQFGESKGYISTRFQPEGRNKFINAFREHKIALAIGDDGEIQALG
jgi:hypothetical protein